MVNGPDSFLTVMPEHFEVDSDGLEFEP